MHGMAYNFKYDSVEAQMKGLSFFTRHGGFEIRANSDFTRFAAIYIASGVYLFEDSADGITRAVDEFKFCAPRGHMWTWIQFRMFKDKTNAELDHAKYYNLPLSYP